MSRSRQESVSDDGSRSAYPQMPPEEPPARERPRPDRPSPTRASSPAVGRALTVLETLVAENDGMTLTTLARRTGIPLATCAAIVNTLEERGYAARRVVGRSHFWRATFRLYGLGAQLVRKADVSTVARDEMRALADRLTMPVHIGMLTGSSVVYVAKEAGDAFIQFNTYLGKVSPFDLTALGRAIAAYLPEDELAPLLSQLTTGSGPNAHAPDPAAFLRDLEKVRQDGYAVEDEEEQADIGCVAAPFFDNEGRVAGAVGVTGFARDLHGDRLRQVVDGVLEVAGQVSMRLGHRSGQAD
ncbi:IclR family transcriptional regulator [Actinoallomurus iriomotensis]|uniref:IclR family transcriptional regulator n=1 Tax=Actinoallomurus iriomotensis TaxID=478107 RepID=A0A9W6R9J2_9ACTN|nr:IclR family transcriptional regulator [Actinoallomurus iriomotensis]GLY71748.1 IclR family transcriptional regulator [Actinoallomurus iriomotensis]